MPAPTDSVPTVKCPHCGKPVPWTADSPYRPFCSERCKLIDLGRWLDGKYQIPVVEDDLDEGSGPGAAPDVSDDEG